MPRARRPRHPGPMPLPAPAAPPPAVDPDAPRPPRPAEGPLARYGFALVVTLAALGVSVALGSLIERVVFVWFFAAVAASARRGGLGPGVFSAVLSIVLADWFLIPPRGQLLPQDAGGWMALAAFGVVASLVSALSQDLRRARLGAEGLAARLARRNHEMGEQAAELEQQTEEAQALAEELEEAQRHLQESMEAQLAEAQRIARLGSWEWDVAADRVSWSDEMYRVYGVEPGAFPVTLGTFVERVHPQDRERVRVVVDDALRRGLPFEMEHRILLPDGRERRLHARGEVQLGASGLPVRMYGTGIDVTEQREAEEATARLAAERAARAEAEAARARMEGVLEAVSEAFIAFDAAWRYTFVNRRAEEMVGHPRAELLGRRLHEVFPDAEGRPTFAMLRRVRERGVPETEELWSATVEAWLEIRAYPWEGGVAVFYDDVSERRAARQQLARLAAIVESSDDAIIGKTLDGTITSWNAGAERLYGYTRQEMVGRSVSFLTAPERGDDVPEILRRLAAGEHLEAYETVRVRRDGTRLDVLLTVSPVRDERGTVVAASTIARDVTQRKRVEERMRFLAEASRVLASSLEPSSVLTALLRLAVPVLADMAAVYTLGDDGAIRPVESAHADPAEGARFRATLEALDLRVDGAGAVARTVAEGSTFVAPELTDADLAALAADPRRLELLRPLAPRALLVVPLHRDGRTVGAISFARAAAGRGYDAADVELAEEVARRAGTAMENARLHAAEHDARRAAERAAGGIARLQAVTAALSEARTSDEVTAAVVHHAMEALGAHAAWIGVVTPDGAAIEVAASAGFAREMVEPFRTYPVDAPLPLPDALRSGEIVVLPSREERDRRYPALAGVSGSERSAAWAAVPMLLEGRAVGGLGLSFPAPRTVDEDARAFMLALARQAALALERTRLYEAERAARAEAEEANRAKFDFLTTMSHELRTPLNAIAGYAELMEMGVHGPVSEAQLDALDRIQRSQRHLLGLINDVLNFARIEGGHVRFDIADVAVDEALGSVEPLIAPQVRARGLRYELRPHGDGAATVRADREKLQQIVLNLLSNAVKFTPGGGGVTLESEADAAVVRIHVRDTGVGIPADKLQTIFEPFVQVGTGYTRPSEGTGLGLAISRDLARAMAGDITVRSEPGVGSTFTLTLPRGGETPPD